MSARSREMWRILARLNEDADWWPDQLDKMREGATIQVLASVVSVYESVYRNWIRGDAERESQMADALREGKARRLEKVLLATFDTATARVADEIRHSDKLRAAEIYLKAEAAGIGHAAGAGEIPGSVRNITINFVGAIEGRRAETIPQQKVLPNNTVTVDAE